MVDSTGCGAPRASYVKGGAANWRDNGMCMYCIPVPVVFMFGLILKFEMPADLSNVRTPSVHFISFVVFGD